jgi:putative DNA primase/helicase
MINLPKEFDETASEIVKQAKGVSRILELPPEVSRVELISASSIQPEPVNWLWQDWLAAGKLHIIGGAPGTGKTTIALSIASTVSCGGHWADGTRANKGRVVIWSAEDSPQDTLVPRLIRCGADCDFVSFIGGVFEPEGKRAFDPGADIPKLREALFLLGKVDLLIIDPIVSAVMGNDHKNSEVRRSLQPLVDLGSELCCAVLGVTHFSKNTAGRNPLERVTGSLAFGALARVVWVTAKGDDSEGKRLLLKAKSNIGPDDGGFEYELIHGDLNDCPGVCAASVVWGEPMEGSTRDLLALVESPTNSRLDGAHSKAQTFLARILSIGHAVPAKEIQDEAKRQGITTSQLRTARDHLGVETRKVGMKDGGWEWSLNQKVLKNAEGVNKNYVASSAENRIFDDILRPEPSDLTELQAQKITDWLIKEGDGDLVYKVLEDCQQKPECREWYLDLVSNGQTTAAENRE